MAKSKNYEARLIKDFLKWVESKHFTIMENGSFKGNNMFFNQRPKPNNTMKIDIRLEMRRPSQSDMDEWVDLFLKKYDEKEDSEILG